MRGGASVQSDNSSGPTGGDIAKAAGAGLLVVAGGVVTGLVTYDLYNGAKSWWESRRDSKSQATTPVPVQATGTGTGG